MSRNRKCLNSLALSNPFPVFSVVPNSNTKRFSNMVLDLTYARTGCVSFVPSLASAQQLVVTFRSSKTDSFRLGQSHLIARTASRICAVIAMQHYFQLAATPLQAPFFFPVQQAPYQVSGHFPPTGYRASRRASFS